MTRRQAVGALVASWGGFFANAVLHPTLVPYYRDHVVTNIPVRDYVRDRLLSGELPQWFPYEGLGVPLIGQIALGTFHPFNLLTVPLPAVYAEKWVLLGAYLFGLCGAYRAARAMGASRWASVLGAWTYGFGGYVLGVSCIIAYALSTAALPWVVASATRLVEKQRVRDAALLAGSAAMVFIAGDALGYALTALLCSIAFSRRPTRRAAALLVLAGVWSAALVAIELFPATVLGADSVRNVGQPPPTLAFTWATHPLRLVELVHAGLIPDEVRSQLLGELFGGGTATFATTLYFGVLSFAALAAALPALTRPTALALSLCALALMLAMGGHLGLLGVLQRALPLLGKFRYPERYLAFFWVGTLWLVPLGFDRAVAAGRRAFLVGLGLAAAVNLMLVTPAAVDVVWGLEGRVAPDELAEPVWAAWRSSGVTAVVIALVAAALFRARSSRVVPLGLAALLFADLWRANAHHLPLVEASAFRPSPLAPAVHDGRVVSLAQRQWPSGVTLPGREEWVAGTLGRLRPTCASLSRVETLGSNLGAMQRRHALVFGVGHDATGVQFAGFFNGCFAVVDDPAAAPLQMSLQSRPCWPRAFLASAYPVTLEGGLRGLQELRLDARRVPWEAGPVVESNEGTVTLTQPRPERLELEVEAPQRTALVVSNDFVPGWIATVDGREVPLYATMVAALGLEVPAGKHEVRLEFHTPRLAAGAATTICALALLLVVLAIAKSGHLRQHNL